MQPQGSQSNSIHKSINSNLSLPSEYLHYQSPYRLFLSSKSLFKVLLIQWNTCLMCILKIYCIQFPKMYSDSEFLTFMITNIFCSKENSQSQIDLEQFLKKYNSQQKIYNAQSCWLCEELMQTKYLKNLKQAISQKIQKKNYGNYLKYKLNIRVPLIFSLKYYLVCLYLWHLFSDESLHNGSQENSIYKVNKEQLAVIHKILKQPYDKLGPKCQNNPVLQVKVVQKWLISFQINTQTDLQSTIEQLQDMLTINIQHEFHSFDVEDNVMRIFCHLVGLQKKTKNKEQRLQEKPQKKIKIDLTDLNEKQDDQQNNKQQHHDRRKHQSFRCIVNNVNKILYVKYGEMKHIFSKFKSVEDLKNLFTTQRIQSELSQKIPYCNEAHSISRTIKLQTKNICLSGKYCKYSRYLSQTPWTVNGVKLTESSLQQQIQEHLLKHFYPSVPKDKIQTKFHSGGRQDIDVRMLKGGRPFALELVNPIYRINDISLQKIIEDSKLPLQTKQRIRNDAQKIQLKKAQITFALQQIVNESTQLVQIKSFQEANQNYVSVELKKAQIQKIKHYVCYIASEQVLTKIDKQKIQAVQDLQLDQKTPLRVLHRRTLMIRKKIIHKMYMHLVTQRSAVVEIWASAGTYIKEFVHGDLERTLPNFGTLIGKKVDILQLDVGSLKEGNWEKGDDLKMKLDNFDWKNE